MKKQILFFTSVMLVLVAVFSRMIPHPWNFTAVVAAAVFSGALIRRQWLSWGLPVLALFIGDLVQGLHVTMPFTYLGVILAALLGRGLIKKVQIFPVAGTTVLASLVFFVVSNFGVWWVAGLYPMTWDGLVTCFVMAVPFLKFQLLGDLFFSGVLFGCHALVKSTWAADSRETAV